MNERCKNNQIKQYIRKQQKERLIKVEKMKKVVKV